MLDTLALFSPLLQGLQENLVEWELLGCLVCEGHPREPQRSQFVGDGGAKDMRKVDSASEASIEDPDARKSVKNVSPSVCADGKLAAYVQTLGRCGGNGVKDDGTNGGDTSLEELRGYGIHMQRYEPFGFRFGYNFDIDGQLSRARIHTNAKEGRVIDRTAPRKVVLDEIHKSLNFRNSFDASTMNLEVNEGGKSNVGNERGTVIGRTEQPKRHKVREWNQRELFDRRVVVQRKGLFKDGLVREVEVLQKRHVFERG